LNDLGAPIYLPPLNDRREDIPEILDQIVGQIIGHLGRPMKQIDDRVFTELKGRDWTKKNVVALRQIAEHAVIAARDFDEILVRHLPPPIDLPNWAGSRPMNRRNATEAVTMVPTGSEEGSRTMAELLKVLETFDAPKDSLLLDGVLPLLQSAHARLVLKLFGAALRATRDRRGETSSLSAVCKLLGVNNLKGTTESYAAYDIVLRIVSLCDAKFEGIPAERCELLSEEEEVRDRVQQAITQRRRPKKTS
jgi:hypothetical protein